METIILFAPLIGALVCGFGSRIMGDYAAQWTATMFLFIATALSWIVFLTIGTIIGGFTSGWIHNRVRLETNRGPRVPIKLRWVMAFIGGALMGFGARYARGCTSGQALSGGAVLSVGSWLFMFAVFGGAYALAYSLRKFWN